MEKRGGILMGNKAVFIGLGGAGVYSTGYLKAKLLFDAYNGDEEELGKDCRFIFIDTDNEAVDTLNREYQERFRGGRALVTTGERVNMGYVNPSAIYLAASRKDENRRTDEEKHFLSWVDEKGSREFMNQPLMRGAGANRQQGRIAIRSTFNNIRNRIISALNVLQDVLTTENYNNAYPTFYILSGTCGGTGSASFLDVAYILDREFKIKCPMFGDPVIRGVLFMPQWYIETYRAEGAAERTIQNYYCNGYAFFDELRVFLKDRWIENDGTKFNNVAAVRVLEYEEKGQWPLFNFAFCIDSTTENGFTMTDQNMYRNTAELLYYWHLGSVQGTVISGIDNEHREFPNTPPKRSVPAFSTVGYRALRFPEELMKEYFERRFLYELFRYGLQGKGYRDAIPNEDVRNEELDNTFKESISRYLFQEAQEEGIPNLEASRIKVLESQISTLTLDRFNKKGKSERDPDKISNSVLLDGFIRDAKYLISLIKRDMEEEFSSPNSDTGCERLLRHIQQGFAQPEGTPKGSLEVDIENAILRYGLSYAEEFVRRLDIRCEERINSPAIIGDLTDLKNEKQYRKKELEAEIDSAKKECISTKGKKSKINALNELYNKLLEDIRISAELEIIEQQIQVLNRLSLGETGILDMYKRKLRELADRVRNRLEGERGQQIGFEHLYKSDLPKLFLKTRDDVTTTYLPDVATFIGRGEWKTDHLFARLYKEIVKQEAIPGGGEEPLRYGQNYGRDPNRGGLHQIMWEILTSPEYTNMDRGYEEYGNMNFFRRFFSQGASFEANEIISLIEKFATRYIRFGMERSQNIRNELNKGIAERFNNLSNEEKGLVTHKFSDIGTQTFCPMSHPGGEMPTTYNVYAGNDEELARELGFNADERTHQFVQENVPNRFLKIKVLTRHTLEMYPNYSVYESIYHQVKQQRGEEGPIFAPHIHKLFNQLGVEEGLQMLGATGEGLLDKFALTLLYRELLEKAFKSNRNLVEELIYIDDRLKGDEETCYSPLIISVEDSDSRVAMICNQLGKQGNKLLLKRKNYVIVSNDVMNYKVLYDAIESYDYLPFLRVLSEFDQHFQKSFTAHWRNIFNEALESLNKKVKKGVEGQGDIGKFYTDLNNSLTGVSDRLKRAITKSEGSVGAGEERKREEMPV